MDRQYKPGQIVLFTDENGKTHNAIVTCFHYGYNSVEEHKSRHGEPCINLVYTSSDERKEDCYGRQLERNTSVVHKSHQWANGMFYRFPDEV